MSSPALSVRVCPEQARELILDWLVPMTENGTMDELFQQFVKELEPYASSAAERVLRRKLLSADPNLIFVKLRPFLEPPQIHSARLRAATRRTGIARSAA